MWYDRTFIVLASTLLKCCCARFIWANHSWHFIDINMKSAANGIVQRIHVNRMWTNKTLTKKCWKKNGIKKLVIGKVWRDATDLMWKRINNNIKTCNNFDKLEFDIWWKLKRKIAKNCKMANKWQKVILNEYERFTAIFVLADGGKKY